jgi:2-polyprenyl-6-methoxyphenol hydroxylase-like FAD-dependent oxidoreductase
VLLGRGRSFLLVPIGSGRTYCYADVSSTDDGGAGGAEVDRLRELFAGFRGPVPEILAGLDRTTTVYVAPIEEVETPSWTADGWALVGDAAHATSPVMAQGAAMAMEDALVLAECLAGAAVQRALGDYERRRRPRAGFVQAQAHRRDRARGLPPAVRDLVLRTAGARIYHANYHRLLAAP